jgi:predicted DNA-binding ArsR family transcriptional regulator
MVRHWSSKESIQEVDKVIHRLMKKNPSFTMLDVSLELGIKPKFTQFPLNRTIKQKTVPIASDHTKKNIRKILLEAESTTHPSLAHEVFEAKKQYGFKHIKSFFGKDLGQDLLDNFIIKNFNKSMREISDEFKIAPSSIRSFVRNNPTEAWTKWVALNRFSDASNMKRTHDRDMTRAKRVAENKKRTLNKYA